VVEAEENRFKWFTQVLRVMTMSISSLSKRLLPEKRVILRSRVGVNPGAKKSRSLGGRARRVSFSVSALPHRRSVGSFLLFSISKAVHLRQYLEYAHSGRCAYALWAVPFALETSTQKLGVAMYTLVCLIRITNGEADEKREIVPISESAVPLLSSASPRPIKKLRSCI
jgi:hypothetical protein